MKYYSTQRPIAPGTFPREGVLEIENYDYRLDIPEIGSPAWGEITYSRELTQEEMASYELVAEG